ncbi:MAG TPA: efflux RND transporter periplasmic adaptor subunit [Micropepsaceae bacterium]|nr:efflux RND transporter periplasmic adaptor subunit [Micropepsaceae bacterium]
MSTVTRTILIASGFIIAGAGGYTIARLTGPDAPPPPPAAAAPAAANEVKVDASYLAVVGIKTESVAAGDLSADVLAPATVTAAPEGMAVVTAHAAGSIVRLTKRLGDPVKAGEMLAIVESRDAAAMVADRTVAESKAALARSTLAREQELYNQRVTPRQDLERAQAELAAAEAEVRRARDAAAAAHLTADGQIAVTSPLTGRITSAYAALGTFVQAETELFRIVDPNFIQIEAAVPVMDAQRIEAGDPAKLSTPSGATLGATVRSITPTVNEQTRTTTVVLAPSANHEPLSPGEIVQADIVPKRAAMAGVVVPEDAVQNIEGRTSVFVRTATGFKVQPVVVGIRSAGRVAIVSGLDPGTTIATTNAFFLKAELGKGAGEEE